MSSHGAAMAAIKKDMEAHREAEAALKPVPAVALPALPKLSTSVQAGVAAGNINFSGTGATPPAPARPPVRPRQPLGGYEGIGAGWGGRSPPRRPTAAPAGERMELGDAATGALAQSKSVLAEFERKKKLRQLHVPTDDGEVKARLRATGCAHPAPAHPAPCCGPPC